MSARHPEPGEIWSTNPRRAKSGKRPIQSVKIISCPTESEVQQPPDIRHYVLYEFLTGRLKTCEKYHQLDTFVQRYERLKEAEK